ncbi:hypothetical protein ACGFNU_13045 [Spirillospora sp. NPDC048911]|uniref:hypothetical protein n=1 Tax=Spirillospora sp. NPDC048911 TaxID=3364527 RepID=UPI00371F0140
MSPEQAALALMRHVADTVPAYAAFLADHDIDPAAVTALHDVPVTTKDTYVRRRYPLAERCRDGTIGDMIAVSSGSTGEPTFWPRSSTCARSPTPSTSHQAYNTATPVAPCRNSGWLGSLGSGRI